MTVQRGGEVTAEPWEQSNSSFKRIIQGCPRAGTVTLHSAPSGLQCYSHSWAWLSSHMGQDWSLYSCQVGSGGPLWLISLCLCVAPASTIRHTSLPSQGFFPMPPAPLTREVGEPPPTLCPGSLAFSWTPQSQGRLQGVRRPGGRRQTTLGSRGLFLPLHPGMCCWGSNTILQLEEL